MSKNEEEKKEVKYYGKKAYIVNPHLIRRKPEIQKVPDYKNEKTEQSIERPTYD